MTNATHEAPIYVPPTEWREKRDADGTLLYLYRMAPSVLFPEPKS